MAGSLLPPVQTFPSRWYLPGAETYAGWDRAWLILVSSRRLFQREVVACSRDSPSVV
jgi:hypothetical protein